MNKYVSEFIGTFALVFAGTGAIVVHELFEGVIGHVGIAMTFGLIVMAMIYSIGDISGAHINPAVTLGFAFAKRSRWRDTPAFIVSQLAGAIAASLFLTFLLPQHETLGATLPAISAGKTFVLEVVLAFILMFVILHVSTGAKEKGLMAGVAVGGTVCLAAMFAGPVTGASMNPARSLAPALVSGHLEHLWIYLLAPCAGVALAVLSCRIMRDECCAPSADDV